MKSESTRQKIVEVLAVCLFAAVASCGGDESAAPATPDRDNVDAMSEEHAGDDGMPSPAGETKPAQPVIAERLPYAEVEDELVYGHFVFPEDMVEPLPAIIVIHEWWGLNDGVRAMADRIAGQGYIVLAVDLFGGATAGDPSGARELMLGVVEDPEPANENIRQAFRFVRDTAGAPSVASLGWCFGGGWSLNTALLFPEELDAAVIYYGQVTDDEERLRPLGAPILGLFAENDRGIPVESVRAFEASLGRLRKDFDIRIYPDVGHAFANPSGRNYDEAAATDAWSVAMEFLGRHLVAPRDAAVE